LKIVKEGAAIIANADEEKILQSYGKLKTIAQ